MLGVDALKKAGGFGQTELRIMRFDTQKELVVGSPLESRDVEQRMMRFRKLVECQHPENRERRSAQYRQLECDGNKCRPAVQRAATNVHRIRDCVNPKLEEKAG